MCAGWCSAGFDDVVSMLIVVVDVREKLAAVVDTRLNIGDALESVNSAVFELVVKLGAKVLDPRPLVLYEDVEGGIISSVVGEIKSDINASE